MPSLPLRVYYEDTDAGGVVYYANYLKFMERARTEFLRAAGFDQSVLQRTIQHQFVVRSVTLDLHRPARLDDQLEVRSSIAHYGRASLLFAQQIMRHTVTEADISAEPLLLCSAKIKIACVDSESFCPAAIPNGLVAAIKRV